MKEDKIQEMVALLGDKELVSSEKSFFDTFPVTLIEYIIDIQKIQDDSKLNQALSFLENLPLFEEEVKVLWIEIKLCQLILQAMNEPLFFIIRWIKMLQ